MRGPASEGVLPCLVEYNASVRRRIRETGEFDTAGRDRAAPAGKCPHIVPPFGRVVKLVEQEFIEEDRRQQRQEGIGVGAFYENELPLSSRTQRGRSSGSLEASGGVHGITLPLWETGLFFDRPLRCQPCQGEFTGTVCGAAMLSVPVNANDRRGRPRAGQFLTVAERRRKVTSGPAGEAGRIGLREWSRAEPRFPYTSGMCPRRPGAS